MIDTNSLQHAVGRSIYRDKHTIQISQYLNPQYLSVDHFSKFSHCKQIYAYKKKISRVIYCIHQEWNKY